MPQHLPNTSKKSPLSTPLRRSCLVASLAIALLFGCQDKPAPSPSNAPTPISSPKAAAKDPEGILERVKARGKLICGVNGKLAGFSYVDDKGAWSGLDVDYCKAIAAAVLGDAKAVDFKPLLAKDRFTALQNGDIDILMRNTTRTLTRDVTPNIAFAPTTFFDGQGLMIRTGANPSSPQSSASPSASASPTTTASPSATPSVSPSATPSVSSETKSSDRNPSDSKSDSKLDSKSENKSDKQTPKTKEELAIALKELTGKKICVETGINAANLEFTFKEANVDIVPIVLADLDSVLNGYSKGDCEIISSEKSQLAAWRNKLPRPVDHKILDLSLSKEPLSPVLVGNDDRWRDVVTWD